MNVPTWTGRHGEGGLPSGAPQRRFGSVANPALGTLANGPAPSSGFSGLAAGMASGSAPRSSDLLAHLRQRQQNATAVARRSEDSVLSQEVRILSLVLGCCLWPVGFVCLYCSSEGGEDHQ